MKGKLKTIEIALLIGVAAALVWGMWSLKSAQTLERDVVRIHIIANSDSEADQTLKIGVRDTILKTTGKILKDADNAAEATALLTKALPDIQTEADSAVEALGGDYGASVIIEPTAYGLRVGDGYALPSGSYTSLKIILGDGGGHNWWGVLFPNIQNSIVTDEEKLITQENTGYEIKFKSVELWQELKSRLN